MADKKRQRRQYESGQLFVGTDQRFPAQSPSRGFTASPTALPSDRFRPLPPTTLPSNTRGGTSATAYPYYSDATPYPPVSLQASSLQYQAPNYGTPGQRQQAQSFVTYSNDPMYNLAPQTPQSTIYESPSQFQARQPAGMQVLSDVAPAYFSNESIPAPGPPPSSTVQHHGPSGSTSTAFPLQQESPGDRAPLLQQGYTDAIVADVVHEPEMIEEFHRAESPSMEAAYTGFQTALKEIFQNIIGGCLGEASQSLLKASEWLLGHVGDLGLTIDEITLHGDRIQLWGQFNTAWLAIFQKQKDLLESGERIQHPQNLMSQQLINRMAGDLIRMCDMVEKHGLVDYQYGVAEERIIMSLTECLELQESIEGVGDDALTPKTAKSRAPP